LYRLCHGLSLCLQLFDFVIANHYRLTVRFSMSQTTFAAPRQKYVSQRSRVIRIARMHFVKRYPIGTQKATYLLGSAVNFAHAPICHCTHTYRSIIVWIRVALCSKLCHMTPPSSSSLAMDYSSGLNAWQCHRPGPATTVRAAAAVATTPDGVASSTMLGEQLVGKVSTSPFGVALHVLLCDFLTCSS
jgi:hypothetical protein